MAVTDPWQMAVALPIRNNKFRYYTQKGTTLNGAVTTGASTATIDDTDPDMDEIAQKGDSVVFGPSTNSSYIGKAETKIISSLTSTVITPIATMTNSYADGDGVRVFGTKLAGGWLISYTADSGTISEQTAYPKSIVPFTGSYAGGKIDNYCQHIIFDFSDVNFKDVGPRAWANLYNNFNSNPFLELIHYRAGMIYKSYGKNVSGQAAICISLSDGKRNFATGFTTTLNSEEFTELTTGTGVAIQPSTIDLSNASAGNIKIFGRGYGIDDYVSLFIDTVYAEHAHGTTPITQLEEELSSTGQPVYALNVTDTTDFTVGERIFVVDKVNSQYGIGVLGSVTTNAMNFTDMMLFYKLSGSTYTEYELPESDISAGVRVQQANDGYYEFTETADRNSIRFDIINDESTSRLADGSLNFAYPSSDADRGDRFILYARFSNVPETMWQKLMVLYRWQKRGNFLNLHPQLNDLPPTMTGIMRISNITKSDHWDLTYRSFDFTFEEAII